MVLGQACFHLGLMEDAVVLLQTGRRLATAARPCGISTRCSTRAAVCCHTPSPRPASLACNVLVTTKPEPMASVIPMPRTVVTAATAATPLSPPFQGVFCRDMAVVGTLLSRGGFDRPIPVKCEAMSC